MPFRFPVWSCTLTITDGLLMNYKLHLFDQKSTDLMSFSCSFIMDRSVDITDYTAIFVSIYPWETRVNPHTTTQSHIPHLKYRPNLSQATKIIFDIRISAVYPSKDCKLCHGKSSQLQPWFVPQEPQFTDLSGEYNLTTTQIEKKKPKPSTYIRTFSAWSWSWSFPITSLATLTFETSYPGCLVLQKRLVIR